MKCSSGQRDCPGRGASCERFGRDKRDHQLCPSCHHLRICHNAREAKASRYIPDDLRVQVIMRDQARCRICSGSQGIEVDHVLPIEKGGKSTLDNLQVLCRLHNRRKSSRLARI